MGYHTCAFNLAAAAAGAVNADATFVTDTVLRGQNNHLIITSPFKLLGVTLIGASVIRGRWQIPAWNFYGEPTIYSSNRGLQPVANPQWDLWGDQGPMLPMNQEIQLQISNNLGAATEQENGIVQLGTPNWNRQVEPPLFSLWTRATFVVTPTINVWSGPQSLVLSQSLLGGTYGVRRCIVQGSNAAAWRFIFARPLNYLSYPLRPGDLIQNAVGDQSSYQDIPWDRPWGRMGYFSTLEMPQIEVLGTTAGAITYQVFMLLDYLSQDVGAIENYVQSYQAKA